ncbi:MAG: AAA family ATPase, partial [bacterium]|nr:AAA family ATPase [bacterium]
MSTKKLPVGVSDFKKIIRDNYCYVDKTLFIKEIIDKGDTILLIPRPRRFGKTLNLSMLKYFYDCRPEEEGDKNLFNSLAIQNAGQPYLDKMGKHPVIFISFRTIKEPDWETTYRKIKKLV